MVRAACRILPRFAGRNTVSNTVHCRAPTALSFRTALLGGLLVSPFAARLLPFGWDTQAAATIMRADRWHAGGAMMEAEDPNAWRTLANAVALTGVNQAAIDACREVAEKTKKEQHCAIVVPAPTAP